MLHFFISILFSAEYAQEICDLYPAELKPLIENIIDSSMNQLYSPYGTIMPFEFDLVLKTLKFIKKGISENLADQIVVADVGAGSPEMSWLCALLGAKVRVQMIDHRNDFRTVIQSRTDGVNRLILERAISADLKVSFQNACKQCECKNIGWVPAFAEVVFRPTYDVVVARNLLHFFDSAEQLHFSSDVRNTLKPGGICAISVDSSARPTVKKEHQEKYFSYLTICKVLKTGSARTLLNIPWKEKAPKPASIESLKLSLGVNDLSVLDAKNAQYPDGHVEMDFSRLYSLATLSGMPFLRDFKSVKIQSDELTPLYDAQKKLLGFYKGGETDPFDRKNTAHRTGREKVIIIVGPYQVEG